MTTGYTKATLAQTLEIERLLAAQFDKERGAYINGYDDETVAKAVAAQTNRGLAPASVARHRLNTGRRLYKEPRNKEGVRSAMETRVATLEAMVARLYRDLGVAK